MCKGFMFISREKIDDFEWSNNPNVFYVFFKLLFKASYKDKKWEGVDIKRGQLVTGRVALSKELNVSEQVIRTCLDKLTKTGYINQQTTNRYTIITICNYDSWQVLPKTNNQQPTSEPTNNQPTDNHYINKYNKENKDIKEEESNDSKKKEPVTDLEIVFEAFRRKYKEYGGSARGFSTEFDNLKKKHKDWKEIIPMLAFALDNENRAREDAKRIGDFFPQMKNLQTYINQRSWEAYSDGYENYDPDAYHPEGFLYDAEFDAYRFCDYIPNHDLLDGYTDDNRPDGARIVEQRTVWVWSSEQRRWNKELKK